MSNTVSILNNHTFQQNSVKHTLYQQFCILDAAYARFVDFMQYTQPSQLQLDKFQADLVLCPSGDLLDDQIYAAYNCCQDTSIMTVSCRGPAGQPDRGVQALSQSTTPQHGALCCSGP